MSRASIPAQVTSRTRAFLARLKKRAASVVVKTRTVIADDRVLLHVTPQCDRMGLLLKQHEARQQQNHYVTARMSLCRPLSRLTFGEQCGSRLTPGEGVAKHESVFCQVLTFLDHRRLRIAGGARLQQNVATTFGEQGLD